MKRPAAAGKASPKPKRAKGPPPEPEEPEKNTPPSLSQEELEANAIDDTRLLHQRLKASRALREANREAESTSEDAPVREVLT
jgi:hypothetical protein